MEKGGSLGEQIYNVIKTRGGSKGKPGPTFISSQRGKYLGGDPEPNWVTLYLPKTLIPNP